jgi:hypothetical protein
MASFTVGPYQAERLYSYGLCVLSAQRQTELIAINRALGVGNVGICGSLRSYFNRRFLMRRPNGD